MTLWHTLCIILNALAKKEDKQLKRFCVDFIPEKNVKRKKIKYYAKVV